MLSTTANFGIISANLDRSLREAATRPDIALESKFYLKRIAEIDSIDSFMADHRVLRFALKAFNLEDMSYAKAFIRKVLTEGVDRRDSFANTLIDPRYKDFAATFNFERYGTTTTIFERTRQGVVDKFVRNSLEESVGLSDKGAQLALYFERKASSITSSFDILADRNLRQVALVAAGIPESTAALDIDRQAALLDRAVDIEALKDPEKLSKYLTRFTAMWQISNPQAQSALPTILPISAQTQLSPLATSVLSSLQVVKIGGR